MAGILLLILQMKNATFAGSARRSVRFTIFIWKMVIRYGKTIVSTVLPVSKGGISLVTHITRQEDWKEAREKGFYINRLLEYEGIIHFSTLDQVPGGG